MTRDRIAKKLQEDLSVHNLRYEAEPDSVERRSELKLAQKRYAQFISENEIPGGLGDRGAKVQTA